MKHNIEVKDMDITHIALDDTQEKFVLSDYAGNTYSGHLYFLNAPHDTLEYQFVQIKHINNELHSVLAYDTGELLYHINPTDIEDYELMQQKSIETIKSYIADTDYHKKQQEFVADGYAQATALAFLQKVSQETLFYLGLEQYMYVAGGYPLFSFHDLEKIIFAESIYEATLATDVDKNLPEAHRDALLDEWYRRYLRLGQSLAVEQRKGRQYSAFLKKVDLLRTYMYI